MDIIVDANIFMAVILNESDNGNIIEATKGVNFVAPEILPYEIGNALSSAVKRKHVTETEAPAAYRIFEEIPVRKTEVDIYQALVLAGRFNIYAYDAYYLEVARRLDLPLFTLDVKMQEIAKTLNIKIWKI
jgi:predicted nucleic acid-binding protein